MSELLDTYQRALARFVEHTDDAIKFANMGLVEHLLDTLKLRERVYANLRALDALATHRGIDPTASTNIMNLGKNAISSTHALEAPLRRAQEHLEERLSKLNRNTDIIKRTISQRVEMGSRFTKSA